jgi:hypothetical protein
MASLIRARWVQQQLPAHHPVMSANQETWVMVDEDDEILAQVLGEDQCWSASVTSLGHGVGSGKHGLFLSKAAAQRRVEKWFSTTHRFDAQPTAWVLRSTP